MGRRRPGFTLIEIIIVIVVASVMTAIAIPFIRGGTGKSSANGAISVITSLHSTARSAAIQRGRTAVLVVNHSTGYALVVLKRSGTTVVDTVGRPVNLASRFGVTLTTTSDSTFFTPRGIGMGTGNNTITATKSGYSKQLVISAAGRLLR